MSELSFVIKAAILARSKVTVAEVLANEAVYVATVALTTGHLRPEMFDASYINRLKEDLFTPEEICGQIVEIDADDLIDYLNTALGKWWHSEDKEIEFLELGAFLKAIRKDGGVEHVDWYQRLEAAVENLEREFEENDKTIQEELVEATTTKPILTRREVL